MFGGVPGTKADLTNTLGMMLLNSTNDEYHCLSCGETLPEDQSICTHCGGTYNDERYDETEGNTRRTVTKSRDKLPA